MNCWVFDRLTDLCELNRQQIFSVCSVKVFTKPQNTRSLQKNPANAGLWRARVGPSALTTSQHLLTHQVYLFYLGKLETERATQSPEWMLAMYVSANHGYIWVFSFLYVATYHFFWFNFIFWWHCAYNLVMFRSKITRLKKLCFGLKHLFWSPQTQLEMSRSLTQKYP